MSQKTYLLIVFILSMVFSSSALGWTPIDEWEYNLSFEYNTLGEVMTCSTRVGCGDTWDPNYVHRCGVMAWLENGVDWPVVEMECSLSAGGDDCECKNGVFATDGICDLTLGQWGSDANLIVWQTLDPAYDANVIIKADHEYRVIFDAFRWQANDLKFLFYYGDIAENNSVDLDVNTIAEFEVIDDTWWGKIFTFSFKAEGDAPYLGEPLGLRFYQRGQGWHWIDNIRLDYRVLAFAREPSPEDGAGYVPQNVGLNWVPGSYAAEHDVYLGTSWSDVNDADRFDVTGIYRGVLDTNSYVIPEIPLELGQTYYWRVDEVNEDYVPGPIPVPPDHRWRGPIWRFRIEGPAANPIPADTAEGQSIYTILKWEPGTDSEEHDVYFGTDFDEVNEADVSDANVFKVTQGPNSYNPGTLELSQTYYWRIDELRNSGADVIKGYIWSFTTAPHYVIDDMESYVTYVNEIYDTWEPTATAVIGVKIGDANYIHGDEEDGQSMEYRFRNQYSPYYAQTTRTFSPVQDWTAAGFKVLTLYFRASMDNDASDIQPMYVVVTDGVHTGTVECDDPNDMIRGWVGWQEWNIELQEFTDAGVDLTNVTELGIKIGDGSPTAEGYVYFDDIRLYPTRCVVSEAAGSFTDDCDVDGYDLAVLQRDWLLNGIGNVTASPPSSTGLFGHWTMDDNAATSDVLDISGNDNHGVLYDSMTGPNPSEGLTENHSVAGVNDLALDFDGEDDFVELPAMNSSSNTITLAAWVKRNPLAPGHAYDGIVMSSNAYDKADPNYTAGLQFGSDPTNWSANYELSFMWTGYSWEWRTGLYVPPNQWTFTALTVAPDVATIYLHDGITMQAVRKYDTYDALPWSTTFHVADQMQFGPSSPDSERFFPGTVDDVYIYNRTLAPEEILYMALWDSGSQYFPMEPWCANANDDDMVDLKDFAIMADHWLSEVLWP